ncbi:MAG: tetratricopeptide repeat protein [Candidatus Omnitrophica bacterium]|nr:tetratricopeptide repeat protein [Candidatus Omnitrophota bacterium]
MKRLKSAQIFILIILPVLIYSKSVNNGYIWDDDVHIYKNAQIKDFNGLKTIWSKNTTNQYYPLTITFFWLAEKAWGLNPKGYHAMSIVFHIANTLLLFWAVKKLFGPLAFIGALIFAIHPIQVETVAWATEFKNILALFFFLLALLSYLKFDNNKKSKDYIITIGLFLCAVLSKHIAVCFAFIPMAYKWQREGKIGLREIKISMPFLSIGLLMGAIAVISELYQVGARGEEWSLSIIQRLMLWGQSSWFYIYKTLLPINFMFFYPKWDIDPGRALQWLPSLALVSAILLWASKYRVNRNIFTVLIFYIISIFPASGFFNVYPMIFSYVADHFSYLSSPFIILLILGTVYRLGVFFKKNLRCTITAKTTLNILAAVIIIYLGLESFKLAGNYRDEITLWENTIKRNPGLWMPYANLAVLHANSENSEQAIKLYQKAIFLKPDKASIHYNMGNLYYQMKDYDSSIQSYFRALHIDPHYAQAYANLANVYRALNDKNKALENYAKASELKPEAIIYYNMAHIYYETGDIEQAIELYNQALKTKTGYPRAHVNLAIIYLQIEEYGLAKENYKKALEKGYKIEPELQAIFDKL